MSLTLSTVEDLLPAVPETHRQALRGLTVVFCGRLASMNRRLAATLVRLCGGELREHAWETDVNTLVLGEGESPAKIWHQLRRQGPGTLPFEPASSPSASGTGSDEIRGASSLLPEGAETHGASSAQQAAAPQPPEVLFESDLWARLGLLPDWPGIRKWYTPSLLAELVGVPVAVVRRWRRLELILPKHTVHKLEYFGLDEVHTARWLVQKLAEGIPPQTLEAELREFKRQLPQGGRSLHQLGVILRGKQVLLRRGDGLVDKRGQFHFAFAPETAEGLAPLEALVEVERQPAGHGLPQFEMPVSAGQVLPQAAPALPTDETSVDASVTNDTVSQHETEEILSWDLAAQQRTAAQQDECLPGAKYTRGVERRLGELPEICTDDWKSMLLAESEALEDEGDFLGAIESYRGVLLACGPDADICFRLAEMLYLVGELAGARERYYMAIELDEGFIEARASLGCVLMEMEQTSLAVEAFRGVLTLHPDYADVHYHLGRCLDLLKQANDAEQHWKRFFELAPDSPWRDQARQRLKLEPGAELES